MAVSTDSIIHYTDNIKNLTDIIKDGFKIKYCVEALYTKQNKCTTCAHPMISFCDIPLSDSHRHFGLYGFYGIGLSKNWAMEMGINPVLYIEKESNIGDSIKQSFSAFKTITGPNHELVKEMVIQAKCFTKNYSGPLKRGNIDTKDYKFYDEREWRFVPSRSDIGNKSRSIGLPEFKPNKDKHNTALSSYRFKFKTSDISYIIVKETKEIPDVIEFLRNTFYKLTTGSDLDILMSKVCSTEQILQDY